MIQSHNWKERGVEVKIPYTKQNSGKGEIRKCQIILCETEFRESEIGT